MEKPNVFRTSKFYMEKDDTLYMEINYAGGSDTLTIELSREDGTVEAKPTEPLVDLDGNVYTTVIINNQEWIVENFRSTKYADGSSIPVVETDEFDDWFLPSYGELQEIYNALVPALIPALNYWWCSSEFDATEAYYLSFETNTFGHTSKTGNDVGVYACRTFTAGVGSYSLGDTGPGGGWVFYINGTTYYEVYKTPLPLDDHYHWSNIALLIGTGTAIGTGAANTAAIIGQAGHTGSAAKLCDDLSVGGWVEDATGAMCYYDNDKTTYETLYGALYNWWAVNNASGFAYLERGGTQEAGWRVPTAADWQGLIDFAGGNYFAGPKLRKDGPGIWTQTPNTATNDYGFSVMPAGRRSYLDGSFAEAGVHGRFYSATIEPSPLSVYAASFTYILVVDYAQVLNGGEEWGFSVRLVRDV